MFFQDTWVLLLIPFIIGAFVVLIKIKRPEAGLKFSSGEVLRGLNESIKVKLRKMLFLLSPVAACLVVLALARPLSPLEETEILREGIDIVLAVDVSTSMLAEDFKLHGKRQNRLSAVKNVIKDFIDARESDRIGMVVFAARPYTICPLTLDYDWLLKNMERIEIGMVEDGTAIGSGLSASLNRLKDTESKGKVIVLLTDGRNNRGKITPFIAADAAKALNIKVYTIGAGTKGLAPFPARTIFGRSVYRKVKIEIDEDTLVEIAARTGGKYFRAENTESLREIYKEIDRLEKVPVEEKGYHEYRELFPVFLIPGMGLVLLQVVLGGTVLRKLP